MLQTMLILEFKGGPQMDQSIPGNFTAISLFRLLYSSTSTMQRREIYGMQSLEISRMQSLEISRFCILEITRRCIVEVDE